MKNFLIPIIPILFLVNFCSAQTITQVARRLAEDSVKADYFEQAAIRNPSLRQLHISTDIISEGNITSKLNGQPLFKGKSHAIRTNAIFTVPVVSWGKNSISATGSYFQQDLKITDIQSFSPELGTQDRDFNKLTVGLTATFQRMDSLFNRPVFYSASISGVTNNINSIKKLSYLGTIFFPLKQTATTRYSLGVVVNIDPSLNIPAFLLFTYWHKFNHDLELTFNMPSQVSLRKGFSDKMWLTLGTSLTGSLAFFNLNSPILPHDVNYTTIDLKSGLGLEYRIGKKVIFGVNGGVMTPLSARAFERTETSKDYFLSNKMSNVPYMNFSFSILPFIKKHSK